MSKKKLREILSYSGVITNSSTEIYAVYSSDGLGLVKKFVNDFFKKCKNPYTFDDIFKFKIVPEESQVDTYLRDYRDLANNQTIGVEDELFLEYLLKVESGNYYSSSSLSLPIISEVNVYCTNLGKHLGFEETAVCLSKMTASYYTSVYG